MSENSKTFREVQRFRQWYLWVFLLLINGLLAIALYTALFENTTTQPTTAALVALVGSAVLVVLLTTLILLIKLETRIDRHGLYYRFYPIHRKFKRVKPADDVNVYVRTYSPLREYGGWGIRGWGNSKALNISGREGIQIEWGNGRKLLIGTKRAQEAQIHLEKIGFKTESNLNTSS